MIRTAISLAALSLFSLSAACSSTPPAETPADAEMAEEAEVEDADAEAMEETAELGDIVAVASANEDFSTLVAAVQAAGLVETLQSAGPFTVFAPTNAAFAALPEGTLDSLLLPENKDQLVAILTYHVVAGEMKAEAVVAESSLTSVQGTAIPVVVSGDAVMVKNATVVATDVMASNGVIHVIDAVILPE